MKKISCDECVAGDGDQLTCMCLRPRGSAQGRQPWPGIDEPSPEEARHEWERRVVASPTVPQDTPPAVSAHSCILIVHEVTTPAVMICP